MSRSASLTWGSRPTNPTTLEDLLAYIESQGITLTGTDGTNDFDDGSVTSAKTVPGPHFWAAGTKSGAAGSEIYAVTLNPAATALVAGLWFFFTADAALTGATAQVNVNLLGAKYIKKQNGADLQVGDILAGTICEVLYDGTQFWLISTKARPDRIYGGTVGGTANALTVTLKPGTLTLAELTGTEIELTVLSNNTDAVTLTITPSGSAALAAKAITRNGATALIVNELVAAQIIRVVYDGTQFQLLTPTAPQTSVAVVAEARGLVVRTGSPAASRVSVTADELVTKTTAGLSQLLPNVSTYADIGATGAGGLDTGAEANSTFYYMWVIYNPATGTVNGLLSTSSTTPTMPAGFTYKALVGQVYNQSFGDFLQFQQYGREVQIVTVAAFTGNSPIVTTALSLTAMVPPNAKIVHGFLGNTSNNVLLAYVQADSTQSIGFTALVCGTAALAETNTTLMDALPFRLIMRDAQTMYWGSNTARACIVFITGYTF